MPKVQPLLFSILCLLCLSSIASLSAVKSQTSSSNVSIATGSTEPFGVEPFNGSFYPLTGNVFNATFVETGLPPGTQWEVILNGTQCSSTTKTIRFGNVSAATYLWSIPNATATYSYEGNGPLYSASPPSGGTSICPYFINLEQQVTFYPVPTPPPTSTTTPTASLPELSWLATLPLILSVPSVTLIIRHRKNAKQAT